MARRGPLARDYVISEITSAFSRLSLDWCSDRDRFTTVFLVVIKSCSFSVLGIERAAHSVRSVLTSSCLALVRCKTFDFVIHADNVNVAQFKLVFNTSKPKLSLLCSPMSTVLNHMRNESPGSQTRFYDRHVVFSSNFIAVDIVQ